MAVILRRMTHFRAAEIERLSRLASEAWPAQNDRPHPHVLAPELADQNLQEDVRQSALAYFETHQIAWWLSNAERSERAALEFDRKFPTGHLNSSQVACVNHLEPARNDEEMALAVAQRMAPTVAAVRDTGEGGYVAFEWIGDKNYLGERGARTRGANITSLDAMMRVTLADETLALLLVEWKYLESYGAEDIGISKSGTDRVTTYRDLIEAEDSPFVPGEAGRLFYEPYYQLMRQTLLASQYVADTKTPESTWIHLHVIPRGNEALRRRIKKAAPLLLGATLEETWRSTLKAPERYRIVAPSELFDGTPPPAWQSWRRFLDVRYGT
jgi:hypothetical protein